MHEKNGDWKPFDMVIVSALRASAEVEEWGGSMKMIESMLEPVRMVVGKVDKS